MVDLPRGIEFCVPTLCYTNNVARTRELVRGHLAGSLLCVNNNRDHLTHRFVKCVLLGGRCLYYN